MTTQAHLNKAKAGADIEALRAELGAQRSAKVGKLLDLAGELVGRRVFTVPQARAALAELRAATVGTAERD